MKYSQIVPAPKILVRRATVNAMLEHCEMVDHLIETKRLVPVNPGSRVELFKVKDVELAVESFLREGASI